MYMSGNKDVELANFNGAKWTCKGTQSNIRKGSSMIHVDIKE